MTRTLLVVCLVSALGCEKRDPLYCGLHPDDPRCGLDDGGGTGDTPAGFVTIGGMVSGKQGAGLVLQNNGGDDKLIASDGSFQFATAIPMGDPYNVTVGTQPTNPSQMCTVAMGTGTATSDVMDVQVTCNTAAYTVGGTLVGLTGANTVVLTNNGIDDKSLTANGAFTFATPIASGGMYNVQIKSQTGGLACSVSAGMGIVGSAAVTTVVVNCAANTFTIGGTPPAGGVTGLVGTVKLLDNGADQISVAADGAFAFPTPIMGGGTHPYNVTVGTQPSYPPASQTCTVMNGSGTVGSANITNVKVNCATNMFTIGGMVSGLTGTVVLRDNGGDDLTITSSGSFTFGTAIPSGSTYAVTVKTQPPGQLCTITKGTGTVMNGNVTNVGVSCGDPGIKCGGAYCLSGTQQCCDPEGTPHCIGIAQSCAQLALPCDDSADCPTGQRCCAMTHNGNGVVESVACSATCGGSNPVQICDPTVGGTCASGSCSAWSSLPGYDACQ